MQFLQEQKTAPEVTSTPVLDIGAPGNIFIEFAHIPTQAIKPQAPCVDDILDDVESGFIGNVAVQVPVDDFRPFVKL